MFKGNHWVDFWLKIVLSRSKTVCYTKSKYLLLKVYKTTKFSLFCCAPVRRNNWMKAVMSSTLVRFVQIASSNMLSTDVSQHDMSWLNADDCWNIGLHCCCLWCIPWHVWYLGRSAFLSRAAKYRCTYYPNYNMCDITEKPDIGQIWPKNYAVQLICPKLEGNSGPGLTNLC